MPRKPKKIDDTKQKIIQAVGLLKFVLSTEDEEIIKFTIESVIELLEEISK